MGEIALDGYFSKYFSHFFATLTAVFKHFLHWFDRVWKMKFLQVFVDAFHLYERDNYKVS